MPSINQVQYGPFVFSSGFNPQVIDGPKRQSWIVEHGTPGREGGITEYVGSRQTTYTLRGFLAASNEQVNGPAGAIVSGNGYAALNTDESLQFLTGLRGSGANLLRVESTSTNYSGYAVLYENDFFFLNNATFGLEAGKTYPYYPYSLELTRAAIRTFGQGSGTTAIALVVPAFFSGYVMSMVFRSGFYTGGTIVGLGCYAVSVASGSARMAIYNVSGPQGTSRGLVAQTASQVVHSGWNYFPVNPILLTQNSGNFYELAVMGNTTSASGFAIGALNVAGTSGTSSYQSGITYSNGFPDPYLPGIGNVVSGIQLTLAVVTV